MTDALDATRWRIVSSRDASRTHAFVYAVRSTRIYCRPSCPARLARRANVRFYETPAAAAAAGFRACKRCRPDEESDNAIAQQEQQQRAAVQKALAALERERGAMALADLAREVGLSTRYFCGVFRRIVGMPPGACAKRIRDRHVQTACTTTSITPTPPSTSLSTTATSVPSICVTTDAAIMDDTPSHTFDDTTDLEGFSLLDANALFPGVNQDDISWETLDFDLFHASNPNFIGLNTC